MPLCAFSQIGEHRNQWTVGVNGGVNLNSVSFLPKVTQDMYTGMTGGLTIRYTCEKYFLTICSIQAELNYSQLGWKESILDINDNPVLNSDENSPGFGKPQSYERTINYVQLPVFAHLAWGKESQGCNFFFNIGPQVGFKVSETSKSNLMYKENGTISTAGRASGVVAQDTMAVENDFDYGIAAGLGVELHVKHVGRFQLEGRYYYGLGNLYGDSKRDYFASSNHGTISIRAAYMLDL